MRNERTPEGLHATLRNVLQALKFCSRQRYTFPSAEADHHTHWRAQYDRERIEAGDFAAVTIGPLIWPIADAANLTKAQARRYLIELERIGLAMRQKPQDRGTAHRWWPVGFSDELQDERAKVLEEAGGNA
ncbi:FaeA/PapI family transcriptional regulator [Pseudomonas aeruginosa]|nr:FaeA/PapI family transcriptional regulator [Pseudomonas aeruginosa]